MAKQVQIFSEGELTIRRILLETHFLTWKTVQGYGQWRWMWFKHSACDRIGKFSSGVQREPYFLVKALQDYSRHRLAHGIVCSVDTQTQSVLSSINRPWCCCNINLWLQFTANHINFSPLRSSWYYLKVIEIEINFKNNTCYADIIEDCILSST